MDDAGAHLYSGGFGSVYEVPGSLGTLVEKRVFGTSLFTEVMAYKHLEGRGVTPSLMSYSLPWADRPATSGSKLVLARGGRVEDLRDDQLAPAARSLLDRFRTWSAAGLYHMDIKPENCVVSKGDDDPARLLVIDWGLANTDAGRLVPFDPEVHTVDFRHPALAKFRSATYACQDWDAYELWALAASIKGLFHYSDVPMPEDLSEFVEAVLAKQCTTRALAMQYPVFAHMAPSLSPSPSVSHFGMDNILDDDDQRERTEAFEWQWRVCRASGHPGLCPVAGAIFDAWSQSRGCSMTMPAGLARMAALNLAAILARCEETLCCSKVVGMHARMRLLNDRQGAVYTVETIEVATTAMFQGLTDDAHTPCPWVHVLTRSGFHALARRCGWYGSAPRAIEFAAYVHTHLLLSRNVTTITAHELQGACADILQRKAPMPVGALAVPLTVELVEAWAEAVDPFVAWFM